MIPYFYFPEITIGSLVISTYHLMHSLAYVAGGIIFLIEAKRLGLNLNKVFNFFVWAFVGAIVGARIGGVIRYWDHFAVNPQDILNLAIGGWTESGGFILSFILALWYIKRSGLPILTTLDAAAPGMAIRFGISRLGCTAVHDHIGKLMSHPWPWGINNGGEIRHETGMYSLAANLLIFAILWMFRKKIKTPGKLFGLYLFMYSVSVFIIRFFRAEDLPYLSDERYWGLTATQYIAIAVFGIAVYYWKYLQENKK